MSNTHETWAWHKAEELDLSPAPTLMLIALADSADHETGCCKWTPAKLAKRVRVHKATMYRHLADLAALGLIRRAQLRRKGSAVCRKVAFWVNPSEGEWPLAEWSNGFDLFEELEGGKGERRESQNATVESRASATVESRNHATAIRTPFVDTPLLEDKPLTSPRKKKSKARFKVSSELAEDRALFPTARRAGMTPDKQQALYDEVVEEFGRDRVRTAIAAYLKAKGEYVTHFAKFLRDDLENWLPAAITNDEWLKALRTHLGNRDWWPAKYGPKPGAPGCRVPDWALQRSGFLQAQLSA